MLQLAALGSGILFFMLSMCPAFALAVPRVIPTVDSNTVPVNEHFILHVEVRWSGKSDRYLLYPPSLNLPDSIEHAGSRQSFTSHDGETVYSYEYTLIPTTAGTMDLGTVSVDYRDTGSEHSATRPPSIVEDAPQITVLPGGVGAIVTRWLLPIVGLVLAAILFYLYRRRFGSRTRENEASPPTLTPVSLLEQAHSHLIAGDTDRVYEVLAQIKPLLPSTEDPLPALEKLEAERLRARYGNVHVAKEELERLLRSVEALVKPSRHEN